MRKPEKRTTKTVLLSLLAAICIVTAACGESNDVNEVQQNTESAIDEDANESSTVVYDENAATVSFDEPTPISEEEEKAVEEYLFSQLGGNHPEEQQFGFSFPIKGTVEISGDVYYIGTWEMRLYNEMGEESSSQVIMDFMMPTDFSEMYEIYGENGSYTVYMRDVLNQN